MSEKVNKVENSLKKEIGERFRKFRESIGKAQHELASELDIYQSTITNIERGKTFPNIKYLEYFYHKYNLNINWLITSEGEMTVTRYRTFPNAPVLMDRRFSEKDARYEQYMGLFNFMQVPEVEQVMLARLTELKAIFKHEIEEHFANNDYEEEDVIM